MNDVALALDTAIDAQQARAQDHVPLLFIERGPDDEIDGDRRLRFAMDELQQRILAAETVIIEPTPVDRRRRD